MICVEQFHNERWFINESSRVLGLFLSSTFAKTLPINHRFFFDFFFPGGGGGPLFIRSHNRSF